MRTSFARAVPEPNWQTSVFIDSLLREDKDEEQFVLFSEQRWAGGPDT